jgi:hypothetical protein
MKLTPAGVKQLANYLDQKLGDHGSSNPLPETLAFWIADWCRMKMEAEASVFYEKVTDK